MSVNYKSYEFRVYEHISRFDKLLQERGSVEELKSLQSEVIKLRQDFETKNFRVAVVGEFNRGKTTFVNALLGKELLPTDYLPTTAAINRITYGDNPSAYIIMKNGQKKSVLIEELAEYITKLTTDATENASQIYEAVLEYPSLFCRNGVDLIDTPGMNDEADMNRVTISRLESIDLAIVTVNANIPFSITECAFTTQLLESPQICQIIIVVTKIDNIKECERQKVIDYMVERVRGSIKERLSMTHAPDSEIMRKYHVIFDNPCVFAVSAIEALEALSCNNMELFNKSGFRHLNDKLPQIIMSSQNSSIVLNTERKLDKLICKYREWLLQQRYLEAQLNEMKMAFAQVSYETTAKLFSLSEAETARFIPDEGELFSYARKKFTHALGEMKALSHEELKRVFIPVIKEVFKEINMQCHEAESAYLYQYQKNVLDPCSHGLRKELEVIVQPFPEMYQVMEPELDTLPDYLSLKETEDIQDFYWLRSPIPDMAAIGTDWNIMAYVDPVIRSSLADYKNRCWQQIVQIFGQAKQRLDNQIQNLVRNVYDKTSKYIEQLQKYKEEEFLLERLQQLEIDIRELREDFIAEAG
ncbi:MAG: dynamin family protein [Muribaculaceae bacterium]|nr:dynamin family protein [Muribaculaceae bacterium]